MTESNAQFCKNMHNFFYLHGRLDCIFFQKVIKALFHGSLKKTALLKFGNMLKFDTEIIA
jgi:hypothetical protein